MENIFGNKPVSGENFHGRKEYVRRLVEILKSKNSFLLLGLRRTGKSSTIAETLRIIEKEEPSMVTISINCQNYKSIQDFYQQLYLSLPKEWRDKLRDAFKNTKRLPKKIIDFVTDHIEEVDIPAIGGITFRNEVLSYSNTIKEEVGNFFKNQKNHIILSIDELPFLFENIQQRKDETASLEITSILSTLRDWRNDGMSQVICGSLNLHIQLEKLGISRKLLAGLNSEQLPLFTEQETRGLILALDKEKSLLSESLIDQMIASLPDYIPQFIQKFYFEIQLAKPKSPMEISLIYESKLDRALVCDFEYQFQENYAKLLKEGDAVEKILNLVLDNAPIKQSEIIKQIDNEDSYDVLLSLLDMEFLVLRESNRVNFAFQFVRNWWKKFN